MTFNNSRTAAFERGGFGLRVAASVTGLAGVFSAGGISPAANAITASDFSVTAAGSVESSFGSGGSVRLSAAPLASAMWSHTLYVMQAAPDMGMTVSAFTSAGKRLPTFGAGAAYAAPTSGRAVLVADSRGLVAIAGRGAGDTPGIGLAFLRLDGSLDANVNASSLTRVRTGQYFWRDPQSAQGHVDRVQVAGAVRLADGALRICIDRVGQVSQSPGSYLLGLTRRGAFDLRVGPRGMRGIPQVAACSGLGIDSAQRLYVSGSATPSWLARGAGKIVVTRTDRNGLVDQSYGVEGTAEIAEAGWSFVPTPTQAMTASNGVTYIALSRNQAGRRSAGGIIKIDGAGRWLKGFGSQGFATVPTSAPAVSTRVDSLNAAPSGRLVVGFTSAGSGSPHSLLWRIAASNGAPDGSYGTSGVVFSQSRPISVVSVTSTRSVQVGAVPADGPPYVATRLVGRIN